MRFAFATTGLPLKIGGRIIGLFITLSKAATRCLGFTTNSMAAYLMEHELAEQD